MFSFRAIFEQNVLLPRGVVTPHQARRFDTLSRLIIGRCPDDIKRIHRMGREQFYSITRLIVIPFPVAESRQNRVKNSSFRGIYLSLYSVHVGKIFIKREKSRVDRLIMTIVRVEFWIIRR